MCVRERETNRAATAYHVPHDRRFEVFGRQRHWRFGENQGLIVSEIAGKSTLRFPLSRPEKHRTQNGANRAVVRPFHAHVERNRIDRATMVRALARRASLPAVARDPSLARASRRAQGRDAGPFLEAVFHDGDRWVFPYGRAPSRAPTRAGEAGARVTWGRGSPSSPGPRDPHASLPVRALAGGSWPSRRRRHRAPSAVTSRGGNATCRRAVHRRGRGVAAARFEGRRATREHSTRRSRARVLASRSNPRAPASPRAFPRALPETLEAHAALATFSSIPTDAFSPSPRPLHRCSPRMSTS